MSCDDGASSQLTLHGQCVQTDHLTCFALCTAGALLACRIVVFVNCCFITRSHSQNGDAILVANFTQEKRMTDQVQSTPQLSITVVPPATMTMTVSDNVTLLDPVFVDCFDGAPREHHKEPQQVSGSAVHTWHKLLTGTWHNGRFVSAAFASANCCVF